MKWTPYRLLPILLSIILCGCAMQWQPAWRGEGIDTPTEKSLTLLEQAEQDFNQADNEPALRKSIESYMKVLAENPADYQALAQLSTQHILLGTAYTRNRTKKSEQFSKALQFAELAMYTHPGFRKKIDAGAKPWEAASELNAAQIEAMFFWVTAVQYEFKEGMSLPSKIINIVWLQRALTFLNHIEVVAPEYGGGAVEFAKAICYYALPAMMGGSEAKGDISMQRAIDKGDGWLLPRWARGKYYYPIKGENGKAREDLQWVASQALDRYRDPFPWRVHFQQDAHQQLR